MRRLLALMALVLTAYCGRGPAESAKGTSFWYWNTPFELDANQAKGLKELGVHELFVKAGTFSNDGEGLVPILPQRWPSGSAGFSIHLVYNMDSGALRHFEDFSTKAMAKAVLDRYAADKRLAGQTVKGLQLDFDVPTRLLPKYEELLKTVRAGLTKGEELSVTSLPTWFGSDAFGGVVSQVDFYAPQFYDTSVPETLSELKSISDREALKRGLEQAERLGKPFYAGVSSFGRALLYNPEQKLQGAYQGMSPEQAMRHPSLVLEGETDTPEERLLRFRAMKAGANGKGKGWYLVFRIPKPSSVAEDLALVRRSGGGLCRGAAFFRVPEPEESMALPLSAILNPKTAPSVKVWTTVDHNPWARIERQSKDSRVSVTVWFENKSMEPLQTGSNALTVKLAWPDGAVDELQKGGFDKVEPHRSGMRSSLSSSNGVTAQRWSLNAGERVSFGPILLKPGTLLNCGLVARTLSGPVYSLETTLNWDSKDVQKESGNPRADGS